MIRAPEPPTGASCVLPGADRRSHHGRRWPHGTRGGAEAGVHASRRGQDPPRLAAAARTAIQRSLEPAVYIVCVEVVVKPELVEAFVAASRLNHEGTRRDEPGNVRWDLLQREDD